MTGRLQDKRAVVTGAAQGIGRAIAAAFVAEGAQVLLVDVDAEGVARTAAELGQQAFTADLSRKSEIERLFAEVTQLWGGDRHSGQQCRGHARRRAGRPDRGRFRPGVRDQPQSGAVGHSSAARLMSDGAAVVNMSSVNAVLAIPNQIPYAISKGAMKQLTNVTALALAPRGIRVNAIGPGSIMTAMLQGIMNDQAAQDRILSRTPLGRWGEPEEVAAIAVFLASSESSYITGQTIYPDGGRLGLNYTMPVVR